MKQHFYLSPTDNVIVNCYKSHKLSAHFMFTPNHTHFYIYMNSALCMRALRAIYHVCVYVCV